MCKNTAMFEKYHYWNWHRTIIHLARTSRRAVPPFFKNTILWLLNHSKNFKLKCPQGPLSSSTTGISRFYNFGFEKLDFLQHEPFTIAGARRDRSILVYNVFLYYKKPFMVFIKIFITLFFKRRVDFN